MKRQLVDFAARAQRRSRRARTTALTVVFTLLTSVAAVFAATAAQALTVDEAKLIDKGFKVFDKETFKGNGRTCTTCHLPEADFNITAADIPTLSAHQKKLLFVPNVKPGNAGSGSLENQTLLQTLGVFNINDGSGGTAGEVGTVDNPAGPFRASMAIAALSLTTTNFLPDFCTDNSPPSFIANAVDLFTIVCDPLAAGFPSNATPIPLVDVFLNNVAPDPPALGTLTPGVDEGTRNIELGWSGDGAFADPDRFGPTTSDNSDCKDAINESLTDPTDLTKTLRAFSLTAVITHFPKSLNRELGVDIRCPTSAELDAMAAFQEYLGRKFELALKQGVPSDVDNRSDTLNNFATGTQVDASQPVITFNDATAETGKAIFLDGNTECNLCHFNAGANSATGLVHAPGVNDPSAPFPGRNVNAKQLVDLLRCTDLNGLPTSCLNAATASAHGLNAVVTPVIFPQDAGDRVGNGGAAASAAGSECNSGINSGGNIGCVSGTGLKSSGFNVQPLIEGARKKSFFHNGAFNTLESAFTFYFSPIGDSNGAFQAPRKGETGATALANLATTYFSDPTATQDVLNTMGFFLRSLSAVYALADCERLTQDSITLVGLHRPTQVQVMLCSGELDDIDRLIAGAQVSVPQNYSILRQQVPDLKKDLKSAANSRSKKNLANFLVKLKGLRHSIATISPDLP